MSATSTDCCIVGAGPAGAILGLLLARQGLEVTVLEAMHDFERDFRGDTLMPSTLEVVAALGLSEQLERIPHARVPEMRIQTPQGSVAYLELARLRTAFPYVMTVPQARFLEMITAEARRYPGFKLVLGARVRELVEHDGSIVGVRVDGMGEVRAPLTVGADGRFSKVRQLGGFELLRTDQPCDVLSFRLPMCRTGQPGLYAGQGQGYAVVVPRAGEWQVGYTLPKGGYRALRAAGLPALRDAIARLVPWLVSDLTALREWSQTSLLAVESGRVRRWHRPGLLLIGDAAHIMSPVGGVGINCAIQDAVQTARLVGPTLRAGTLRPDDLARVQQAREWQVRVTQACQRMMQRRIMDGPAGLPGLLFRVGLTRRLVSQVMALGPSPDNTAQCSPGSGADSFAQPRIRWLMSLAARHA
jgi:2-polyprenyl-6-methoxyphenol hydroxylase-like FAD-dependent oxidoreductase